jgi:hypothetical protein
LSDQITMIHAFSGAHGTGKTTAAYQYAAAIAKENPGKTVGLVVDVERRCPWPINREASDRAQEWIFTHQLAAETQAIYDYDLVVSDRTILDVVAYTHHCGYKDLGYDMLKFAQYRMRRYCRIHFLCTHTHCWAIEDGCRDTDKVYRAEIETIMLSLYKACGITEQERFVFI